MEVSSTCVPARDRWLPPQFGPALAVATRTQAVLGGGGERGAVAGDHHGEDRFKSSETFKN